MQVKIRLLNQGHSMSDIQKLQYQNQSRNMEHPLKKMHPEEPEKKGQGRLPLWSTLSNDYRVREIPS